MKTLPIERKLDESTRIAEILVNKEVYSLYMSANKDEVIVTDNFDCTKIYAIYSADFWKFINRT